MIIAFLIRNWRTVLFAMVTASLLAYGHLMKWERDVARERLATLQGKVDQAKKVSDDYRIQSERNLEVLRDAIPKSVEQARKDAVSEFKKRYPQPAGCAYGPALRLPALPGSPAATDPAGSTEGTNAADEKWLAVPPRFVSDCAEDSRLLEFWQQWATANKLEVK